MRMTLVGADLEEGTERQVTWTPASDQDQLNLAVRGQDGVAIAELRLCQVAGRRKT